MNIMLSKILGVTTYFQESYTQHIDYQKFSIIPQQQPVRRLYFLYIKGIQLSLVNY